MPNRNTTVYTHDTSYYSPMRGVVVDNNDPKNLGRVRVRIYSMHGLSESGVPDEGLSWAFPVFPYAGYNTGSFIVPEIGTTVVVIFENGDSSKPLYIGALYGVGKTQVTYVGNTNGRKRYQRVGVTEVPHEVESLDTKVLYKSPKGSKLIFNDTDSREGILLVDPLGQMLGITSPMDQSFSENNGHLEDSNITKTKFSFWGGLFRKAVILLKSLTGSRLRILSDSGESEVDLLANGSTPSQLYIDSKGKSHLKSSGTGVDIDSGVLTLSGDRVSIRAKTLEIKAENIDIVGDITINGKSFADYVRDPVTAHYRHEPLSDIVNQEEEDSIF